MKRLVTLLLVAGMVVGVAACAQEKTSSLPAPSAADPTTSDNATAKRPEPNRESAPTITPAAASGSSRPAITPTSTSGDFPSSSADSASGDHLGVKIPYGLVTLIGDVKIPAAETGMLIEVKVTEGANVNEKDVMAVIDNRDTLAKRKMAEGELSVAKEQADSDAELQAAQKAAEVAHAEWQQLEDIRKGNPGAVSLQEVRRAKFQYERALAQIKVAQVDREVARLTMGVKQAQLEATQNELDRREIKSPLKGEVVEVLKKVGEWVQPGEPVARVVSLDKLYVEGFVQASEVTASELKDKAVNVKVFLTRDKEHNVKGKINYVSPLVEGSGRSRQFRVRAEIDNTFADGHWVIQPGSMAEMTVDLNPASPIKATAKSSEPSNDHPRFTPGKGFEAKTDAPASDRFKPVTDLPAGDKGTAEKASDEKPADTKAEGDSKPALPRFPRFPRTPSFQNDSEKTEPLRPVTPEAKTEADKPSEAPRTARPF